MSQAGELLLKSRFSVIRKFYAQFSVCGENDFELHSFAPLATCADHDVYQGLQFVCCPPSKLNIEMLKLINQATVVTQNKKQPSPVAEEAPNSADSNFQ